MLSATGKSHDSNLHFACSLNLYECTSDSCHLVKHTSDCTSYNSHGVSRLPSLIIPFMLLFAFTQQVPKITDQSW